jgi:hypothetical protein
MWSCQFHAPAALPLTPVPTERKTGWGHSRSYPCWISNVSLTVLPSFSSALELRVSFRLLNNLPPFFSILHLSSPFFHLHFTETIMYILQPSQPGSFFFLVVYILPCNILFGIAISFILSTCPNHCSESNYIFSFYRFI